MEDRGNNGIIKAGLTIIILFLAFNLSFAQGVGISSTSIVPDPSSVLELRSSNQGVLVPRMTTAERDLIASPAAGLLIYNTSTQAFNFYQAGWKVLTSGGVTNVTASGNIASTGGATPNLTFTGTLPLTNGGLGLTSGTSGGILGFTAAGTLASSATLTSKALILGGGAGATPTSLSLGTTNRFLGMNAAGTDHEYKTLNGTLNQVIVTNAANSLTLSLPQNIHTAATPTFNGLTLSSLNANGFVYSNAGKAINTTASPTNGQVLIGSTGVAPVAANLTAGSGIAITNAAGSVTIANAIPIGEDNSVTAFSTSLITYTSTGAKVTIPAAGDYIVWFSGTLKNSRNGETASLSMYKGGSPATVITSTERVYGGNIETPISIQSFIQNLTAGQTVEVWLKSSASNNTVTLNKPVLTFMKVK